jgi:hypothetical protein
VCIPKVAAAAHELANMMMRFDGSVPFFEESCSGFFFCSKKELFLSLSFLRASIKKACCFPIFIIREIFSILLPP